MVNADTGSRVAVVGTGARSRLWTRAVAARPALDLVAFADPNPGRLDASQRLLTAELGRPPAALWPAVDDLATLLEREAVDTVVVTSVDRTHAGHIVTALRHGARVVTEKPMTIDPESTRLVLDTVAATGGEVLVGFNYRFNPVHLQVRQLLAEGAVGDVLSVHFEWLLDTHHGADYFRRWHRDKANNGGLMVHKASHHFDLVCWWLDADPVEVAAFGRTAFYGDRGVGVTGGLARDYERSTGSPAAVGDPFALDLAADDQLRELYLDSEVHDGYLRDRNVFAPGVTTEDDMAVLARFDTGASLSYHLTAYSPWEGYRIAFNGSAGRLELEVVETTWTDPGSAGPRGALVYGEAPDPHAGATTITLHRHWQPPQDIPARTVAGGHGGGDERLMAAVFDGDDPGHIAADARDGARALLIGMAANEAFRSGSVVRTADLVTLPPRAPSGVAGPA
jgi:predicted dehydrogenase